MLSLDNAFTEDEIKGFWSACSERIEPATCRVFCEHKLDGLAVSLLYENGLFVRGSTRGNGYVGEDVTANLKTIKTIPLRLKGENIPPVVEIRGEAFMMLRDFEALNEQRQALGQPLFANPRNAAAGSIRQLDSSITAQRKLYFMPYGFGLVQGINFETQERFLKHCQEWGFRINEHNRKASSIEEALEFIRYWTDTGLNFRFLLMGLS